MATSPSSWSGSSAGPGSFTLGSIGLFNSRGEHHHYVDCMFTADTPMVCDGNSWYDGTVHSPDYAAYSGAGTTLQLTQYDTCLFIAEAYNCSHLIAAVQVDMANCYFNGGSGAYGVLAAYAHNLRMTNALLEPGHGNPSKFINVEGPSRNWDVSLVTSVPDVIGIDTTNVPLGGGTYVRNFRCAFFGTFGNTLNGPFGQGDLFYSSSTDGSTYYLESGPYGDASSVEIHDFDLVDLTWMPTVGFGGSSTGVTYGTTVSTFCRNKNRITAQCHIPLTSKGSSTGSLTIGGLPFAANLSFNQPGSIVTNNMSSSLNEPLSVMALANTTQLAVYKMVSGALTAAADTDCTNTSTFDVTITYETN